MDLLLDTHTLIWFLENDTSLSPKALEAIETEKNARYVSLASFWEIVIKTSSGKLEMKIDIETLYAHVISLDIEPLPIAYKHLIALSNIPLHHRDPFDRLLIAQAISESMTIVSLDSYFKAYAVKVLW